MSLKFKYSNQIAPLIFSLSVTRASDVLVVYGVSLLPRQNHESLGQYPLTGLIAGSMKIHSLSDTTILIYELSISLYIVNQCSQLDKSSVLMYKALTSLKSIDAGVPVLFPRLNAPDPLFNSIGLF